MTKVIIQTLHLHCKVMTNNYVYDMILQNNSVCVVVLIIVVNSARKIRRITKQVQRLKTKWEEVLTIIGGGVEGSI